MIAAGEIIFSGSPATEEAKDHARRYIAKHKLTKDDVSLRTMNDNSSVVVVTKREIELQHDGE